ncbi:MAG: hypothetical protein R6V01_10360, partial [Thermoplasmatota archaeon]
LITISLKSEISAPSDARDLNPWVFGIFAFSIDAMKIPKCAQFCPHFIYLSRIAAASDPSAPTYFHASIILSFGNKWSKIIIHAKKTTVIKFILFSWTLEFGISSIYGQFQGPSAPTYFHASIRKWS